MPRKDKEKRREYNREYRKKRMGRPPMKRGSWMIGERNVSKKPEVIEKIKEYFKKKREEKGIYDKDVIELYLEDKLSKSQIARKYNCDSSVINGILKENNIKEYPIGQFNKGRNPPNKLKLDNQQIVDRYTNLDKSSREIAKEYKCSTHTILNILKQQGVSLKKAGYFNSQAFRINNGKVSLNKLKLDEKEIVRLYQESKLSPQLLSKKFGCHRSTIIRVLDEHNVKRFSNGFFQELKGIKNRESLRNEIIPLYEKGISCKDIAKSINKTESFISKIIRECGISIRKGGHYNIGKENSRKIKGLDESEIIRLYEEELKGMKEIGQIVGCSSPTICKILRRNKINTTSRYRQKRLFEVGIRKAHNKKDLEELKIIDLYLNEKKGMNKIAKIFNCDSTVIKRILIENEISIDRNGFKSFAGEKNANWKGGIQYEPYDSNFSPEFKEKIRKRDNLICQGCGRTQEEEIKEFKHKLCIHHIDFNKKNTTFLNCCATCVRCNVLANYDRERWKNVCQNKLSERCGYQYETLLESPQILVSNLKNIF